MCTITEFVEKGNLLGFLAQTSELTASQIFSWAKDISAGMSHLHKEGIVHRDLAARNLLLTETLSIKITDL